MDENQKYRILLVEDEPSVLETMAMVLESDGYEVSTATHGLDALLKLELAMPNLLISDLNMPQMSGFELLPIVRERYPLIPLIAISADHDSSGRAPDGVVADAFYAKGRHRPDRLLRIVAELIQAAAATLAFLPLPPTLMQIGRD